MPRKLPPRPSGLSLESEIVQGLYFYDEKTHNIHPPIYTGTTYLRDDNYLKHDERGYIRDDNASLDQCSAMLNHLEGGFEALLYPSGAAAMASVFLALSHGDKCVIQDSLYYGLPKLIRQHIARYGIEAFWVKSGDDAALTSAIKQHKPQLVWVEVPSNPMNHIIDIALAAKNCQAVGAKLCVDSTAATPVVMRPLDLGADYVIHSATKFLGGHNDLLAGVLVTKQDDAMWQRMKEQRFLFGWMLDPFTAFLLTRSLKTLFLRMKKHCDNAAQLATFLNGHKKISLVRHASQTCHPNYAVAQKQMTGGFGGLMGFHIKGGASETLRAVRALKMIRRATSLGGPESLAEHRFTIEGADSTTPPDLVRFSVGLENADDLIKDWEQALG
ncbi:MAG: PLP-dependent transferase [Hydrotalea sp.]|nr:PLP-dependent transferase [Hydrotalea sp.]